MDKADFSQTANRYSPQPRVELPIAVVDQLAGELVMAYHNPAYRPWYCRVIYTLGEPKVRELMGRAREGKNPARLFSKLASEALKTSRAGSQ